MALLAALIIAFAQPFFAEKTALKEKETVIYLDDSFSMQAKTDGGTLLSDAVQELLKNIPEDNTFSLFHQWQGISEYVSEIHPKWVITAASHL